MAPATVAAAAAAVERKCQYACRSQFYRSHFSDNGKKKGTTVHCRRTTMPVNFLALTLVSLSMYPSLSLDVVVRNGRRKRQKSRKHTIMPLGGFITIIVRVPNNNNMEMITRNRTYVKNTAEIQAVKQTNDRPTERRRKCNCLSRIDIYSVVYIIVKALDSFCLSSFVFCVLPSTIVRVRRRRRRRRQQQQ